MSLLSLPNELLLPIAESLKHAHDVNSLLLTNRRLAILLTPLLNEYALEPKYSMTALFWAAANGSEPMTRLILEQGANIIVSAPITTKGETTDLHQSPARCPDAVVKHVMQQGVNLVLQDTYGANWIPFHWAARNTNLAMIKLLVARGADVDTRDHLGRTSLHLGSWFGLEVVKVLIENGADLAARDVDGNTPLHTAVRYSKAVAQLLLENGADANAKDFNGTTPLHIAAEGTRGCVKVLLEHGADVTVKDGSGRVALYLAMHYKGGAEAVKLLQEKGAVL